MGVIDSVRRPEQRHVVAWAWALLVANTVIILTGGLVRLTASGLGCPTWPRCTDDSFTPHPSLGIHGAIEFGNRLLTYVLIAVAIGAVVAVR
ncbi:MAG: COX15/CtaA family protein, partial [Aeromicrobium erythreum]